jgi:hydroxyacyl-ACP dehydratase HTD2-like protein with hotdog domain
MATAPEIQPLAKVPTHLQLFMFSAVTWNAHRIHYDPEYAREEGYPDILVQSHLHASFLMETLRRAVDGHGTVERFAFKNRVYSVPGERLTCRGRLVSVSDGPDGTRARYELEERNDREETCATAEATVLLNGAA